MVNIVLLVWAIEEFSYSIRSWLIFLDGRWIYVIGINKIGLLVMSALGVNKK